MRTSALKGYLIFEFAMFRRNLINAFFLLIFPTMLLLVFGSIYGNAPSDLYGGVGSIDMSLPAYSGMIVAVVGLMHIPLTLCEYREKGVFKRYRATTSQPSYVIVSHLLINAVMTIIGMGLLILVGELVYHVRLPANIFSCFLVFLISMFCIFSIGFFIGGLVPNMKAANPVTYVIFFPMLFLSGATVPYEVLPTAVQNAVKFLPLTHVVSAMKSVWNGKTLQENAGALLVLLISGLAFLILSRCTFRWEE